MYARRSRYARRRRYPARKRRTRVARSYSRKRTSRRRYGGGRRFKKRVLSIASRKKYDTMRSGGTDGVIDVTFNDAQMAILAWSPTTIPYNQIEHAPAHRNSQEISSSALKNASIHMPFSRSFGGVSCSGPPTIRAIQNHRGTGWYLIPTWRYVRSLRSVGFRHPGVDV